MTETRTDTAVTPRLRRDQCHLFFDPNEPILSEQFLELESSSDLFDQFNFDLCAVQHRGIPTIAAETVHEPIGERSFANARFSKEQDFQRITFAKRLHNELLQLQADGTSRTDEIRG